MQQEFTATKVESGMMEFDIFGVFLSDMGEDRVDHHFIGFQRTRLGPDAYIDEDDEPVEDDGFYIEYNGQENGCYQRSGEEPNVTLVELNDLALTIYFTPAARFHQGAVDATNGVPLSTLVVIIEHIGAQVPALQEALRAVIGDDCPFRYIGSELR